MKKLIAFTLCIAAALLSSCFDVLDKDGMITVAETEDPAEHRLKAGKFPKFVYDHFDEEAIESFQAYEEAVMNGDTSFVCNYKSTKRDIEFKFLSSLYMPIAEKYAVITGISPEDRVATIEYGTKKKDDPNDVIIEVDQMTPEEYKKTRDDFEMISLNILDETCKAEYSDTEKAIALYQYFVRNFKYDPEIKSHMAYGFLTEGVGICQDIAAAYVFLLSQAGIEGFICSAMAEEGFVHTWVIAKLDGHYYHIDPTFGLEVPDSLRFFGMNDAGRDRDFHWVKESITYSYFICAKEKSYTMDDDRFAPLWDSDSCEVDYDNHIVYYTDVTIGSKATFDLKPKS